MKQRFREETFFGSTLPGALKAKSNGNDRRQWRKQGVAVGAAASKMRAAAKQMLGAATRTCRMTLSETILLLTFLVTVAALVVDVAKAVFDVTWKISHDRKDDDNKKD